MPLEICNSSTQQIKILFSIFLRERLTRHNFSSAAMHFEGAHSGNHYNNVGSKSAVATFDIEELFHADVRAEARLGDNVICEFQRDLIRDNGGLSMRDIGEGSGMDEG